MTYDSLISPGYEVLKAQRLAQAAAALRAQTFATREDALAAIYDGVNRVFALNDQMTPLLTVQRESPAVAGDINQNLDTLNSDAQAIVQQLLDVENTATTLYNLFAATQNNLRQSIRSCIYGSSRKIYLEPFISGTNLAGSSTASIDFVGGLAASALKSETFVTPDSITFGTASSGSTSGDPAVLNNTDPAQLFVWTGTVLELLFNFSKPVIINRIALEPLAYQGLDITVASSTPDGLLQQDILAELPAGYRSLDGDAGKFSGAWIANFAPKHVSQLRIRIVQNEGNGVIQLRSLQLSARQYASNAIVQSNPIASPTGTVNFSADCSVSPNLTSVTHQISTDNISYTAIVPGAVSISAAQFWYRATLERLDGNFSAAAQPLAAAGISTAANPAYQVSQISTVDLGAGILQRKISFTSVSAAFALQESPFPGTLNVTVGNAALAPSAYSLTNNVLTLPAALNVVVSYQTSAYELAGLAARQNYYSPFLYQFQFSSI